LRWIGEVRELECVLLFDGRGLKILLRENDVVALRDFISFDDLAPRHFFAGVLTDALVADRRFVAFVQHVERDAAFANGRVELDGYTDEPERDCASPDRWHCSFSPFWIVGEKRNRGANRAWQGGL